MKKIFAVAMLVLSSFAASCFAQSPMYGHADNITLQTPNNYACFPVNQNGTGAPNPYTCTGFGTLVTSSTTFTSLTAIIDRPVTGSHRVAIIAEDFTTGNNIGINNCVITVGQMACTVTISSFGSVSAGDVIAVKVWDDLSGTNYYNLEHITWVLQ